MEISDAVGRLRSYAANNRHGYELGSRDFDLGTDCSGLILYLCALLLDMDPEELAARYPDWSTRTMRRYMVELGIFEELPFSKSDMQLYDVLLKEIPGKLGHTVVVSGTNRIIGAEGNWDGRHGDSSGGEIVERSYYANEYNYILRYKGDEVTDADIEKIADRVADKVIMGTPIDGNNLYNRVLGIDNLTQGNYEELHRTDDPTGRGAEMKTHDHVKWIAKAVADLGTAVEETNAKLAALAEDVAAIRNGE